VQKTAPLYFCTPETIFNFLDFEETEFFQKTQFLISHFHNVIRIMSSARTSAAVFCIFQKIQRGAKNRSALFLHSGNNFREETEFFS